MCVMAEKVVAHAASSITTQNTRVVGSESVRRASADSPSAVRRYIAERVLGLTNDLDQDDIAPTAAAQTACADLLESVETECWNFGTMPLPGVTTSGDGSMHCQWSAGGHRAYLSVDPKGLVRLFTAETVDQRTTDSRTITNPTPYQLASALHWLAIRS